MKGYDLKVGDRVYVELEHELTKETKRRYGTVDSVGAMMVLDMVDVRFDDSPLIVPVLFYLLHDVEQSDDSGTCPFCGCDWKDVPRYPHIAMPKTLYCGCCNAIVQE